MFDVGVNEFSSIENRLLKNIETLLIEQNKLLRQGSSISENDKPDKKDVNTMNRNEMVALIKTLPKGTVKGKYMAMNETDLRKLLKGVI